MNIVVLNCVAIKYFFGVFLPLLPYKYLDLNVLSLIKDNIHTYVCCSSNTVMSNLKLEGGSKHIIEQTLSLSLSA